MERPVVVITGASSGFGLATAKTLAKQGQQVFATMRNTRGKNEVVAAELRTLAQNEKLALEVVDLDVSSDASVKSAIEQILAKAGRIDVLVNNAGAMNIGLGEAWSVDELSRQLDLNVMGVFRATKAVLPGMRKQKSGLVLTVSSIAARYTAPFFGAYTASKAAIESLMESMRYELSSFGVDVALVEPGAFATQLFANSPAPSDTRTTEAYGSFNEVLAGINKAFEGVFADTKATCPQLVADAIATLINTPAGERPLRTVVGLDFGVVAHNEQTEPFRHQVLNMFELSHLENVKTATAAKG